MIPPQGLILNIDKPAGWTSFDVVRRIRKLSGVRKVGHAGTLDPFATGVLVVLVGPMTKRQAEFMAGRKEYLLTVRLGRTSDSYDRTGRILQTTNVQWLSRKQVEVVLDEFQGEIEQTVPLFSAVKVKGKRLYKSARSGEKVELPRRRVNIYTLELQSWDPPWLQLRVESGKGAYMRSLVNDLGNRLGCGALVQELRRLRVGEFRVEEAVSPRQLQDRAGFPWT